VRLPRSLVGRGGTSLSEGKENKMDLITSTEMKTVSATADFDLGKTYKCFDSTLGECHAVFVKLNDDVTTDGAPMYPVLADWDAAGYWLVDEDEDDAGVVGQEWCLGSWVGGAATASATPYGFVQTYGPNLVTITTDDSVEPLDIICPSGTDCTWLGTDRDELVTDATNNVSTRCGFAPAADGGTTMVAGKVFWDVHLTGA
jgi:hypothetical protein